MAAKKSAAEQELQAAEAQVHKLHPLMYGGTDVSPVTRGELKVILEDLLGKLAGGAPISLAKDEKAIGDLVLALGKLDGRVKSLEGAAAPASPAPQVNTDGAADLKALGLDGIKAAAQMNGIDISALPEEIDLLADFVAAAMNAKGA